MSEPMSDDDIKELLAKAKSSSDELEKQAWGILFGAVKTAREADWSYAQIGEVLGVSRQAAWERFSKALKDQAAQ